MYFVSKFQKTAFFLLLIIQNPAAFAQFRAQPKSPLGKNFFRLDSFLDPANQEASADSWTCLDEKQIANLRIMPIGHFDAEFGNRFSLLTPKDMSLCTADFSCEKLEISRMCFQSFDREPLIVWDLRREKLEVRKFEGNTEKRSEEVIRILGMRSEETSLFEDFGEFVPETSNFKLIPSSSSEHQFSEEFWRMVNATLPEPSKSLLPPEESSTQRPLELGDYALSTLANLQFSKSTRFRFLIGTPIDYIDSDNANIQSDGLLTFQHSFRGEVGFDLSKRTTLNLFVEENGVSRINPSSLEDLYQWDGDGLKNARLGFYFNINF